MSKWTSQPGSETLIHYHPEQEETYQVLQGTLEVFRKEQWRSVAAGESLTVPQGALLGFRNTSEVPVRFSSTCTAPRSPSRSTWRRWTA